jgi:hypothetical protein
MYNYVAIPSALSTQESVFSFTVMRYTYLHNKQTNFTVYTST